MARFTTIEHALTLVFRGSADSQSFRRPSQFYGPIDRKLHSCHGRRWPGGYRRVPRCHSSLACQRCDNLWLVRIYTRIVMGLYQWFLLIDSKVSNATGTGITQYAGPAPAAGSGPHRSVLSWDCQKSKLMLCFSYVILLYVQPTTFTPPTGFDQPNMGVSVFDVNNYAKVCMHA